MTKKWRRVYAWVLTVAMVLSMANLPITIAKAASTQNLTVKSGATSVTIAKNEYGDDYIGDMFFNIPDALKTKSAISSNKVTSMTVKITIKSFTRKHLFLHNRMHRVIGIGISLRLQSWLPAVS